MASNRNLLIAKIRDQQRLGNIAEFSITEDEITIRPVGTADWAEPLRTEHRDLEFTLRTSNGQAYYFFSGELPPSGELRPGSGLIRVFGGRPEGPEGTLTCLLSSKDGRDLYFAAAGHVLSNFWAEVVPNPSGSIYLYRKGFPGTNSSRSLGKVVYLSSKPRPINPRLEYEGDAAGEDSVYEDIGIVQLQGEFDLKQRTTCYGSFGEWPNGPDEEVYEGQPVMKCGAEETHWTYAFVESPCENVTVYGPSGLLYQLHNQVILSLTPDPQLPSNTNPPEKWPEEKNRIPRTSFAVPGDSGTMVVDRDSKRPVGMLVAGSVLDGRYVMTPIRRLWEFWTERKLVLRRA